MGRKYLEEIGIKTADSEMKEDFRSERWLEAHKIYGFDERETWDLGLEMAYKLYERLRFYKDYACVNLDFHKFETFFGEMTQREGIDFVLSKLEDYFFDREDGEYDSLASAYSVWAVISPAMWW